MFKQQCKNHKFEYMLDLNNSHRMLIQTQTWASERGVLSPTDFENFSKKRLFS